MHRLDPASAAACTNLTVAMCNDANLQPIAIQKCPKRCGFCDRPGALGRCPDLNDHCALFRQLRNCSEPFMQENCQGTCNLTNCISQGCFCEFSLNERSNNL